jgi:exopolysaccharide biosynthesis protein
MPVRNKLKLLLILCLLINLLLACDGLPKLSYNGTPVAVSIVTPQVGLNTPSLDKWTQAAPGIELRSEKWSTSADDTDIVVITRLDPHKVHIAIGYNASQPLTMNEWMRETGARAIINGGYFDENNQPTGLLITNGQVVGSSYKGFGGMLAVDKKGNVSLRSLSEQPYNPDTDQLQQATQSSPMLLINGKRTHFSANSTSQRRSVVAMDTQGRLLLIVSPGQAFTLDQMANLLASSDLSLKDALNLDGGTSTGLYVNAGNQRVSIDPLTPLPIVIIAR